MKKVLIILHTLFCLNIINGQCIIDSSVVKYYTASDIYDSNIYKSIDSTLNFDTPNSIWHDIYKNGTIVQRIFPNSIWQNNKTLFMYNKNKIVKISKLTRGFENDLVFIYQDEDLIRIKELSKYQGVENEYEVKKNSKGYTLYFTADGIKHWYEINTKLLHKSGGLKYGNLDLLDHKLNFNITNSSYDIRNSEYFQNWPNTEDYIVTCEKDKCGNIVLFSKQSRETLYILELFKTEYTYIK